MTKIQIDEAAVGSGDRLKVRLTVISEMRGTYPEIALPEDIDRDALGAEAFFVTLPIGQAGAKSRNGRRYSRAAVEQMVAQINQHRLEGMWGHLAEDEAQTRYDPPAIRWLAAVLDGEGIAWGKGLPLTAETRDYYRLAKATNARVGTSLVAWAQMDGDEVKALELVTVDLADPARVGVPVTAARAHLSTEMGNLTPADQTQVSFPSPTGEGRKIEPGEYTGSPLHETVLAAVAEVLGVRTEGSPGDVIERVRALVTERDGLREAAITAAVARTVGVPAAVGLVEELVRSRLIKQSQPQTVEEIAAAVATVVEREDVQALLRVGLAQAMGPRQQRPVVRDGEGSGFFSW